MKHVLSLIIAFVVFLLIAGAYTALFLGVQGAIGRIETASRESTALTTRDATSRSLEQLLNTTQDEREILDGFVVHNNDVVSVIEIIEKVAKKEGVDLSISSVSVAAVSGWNHHERVDVQFSANGTFSRLTAFLATLEALPIASRIEGGALEVSQGRTWFGSFSMTFIKQKL